MAALVFMLPTPSVVKEEEDTMGSSGQRLHRKHSSLSVARVSDFDVGPLVPLADA